MATFMEQVADAEDWTDTQPSSDKSSAQELDDLVKDAPRVRRKNLLTSIVKAEILPRLARARQTAAVGNTAAAVVTTEDDTRVLVRLLLTVEAPDAIAFLDTLQRRGVTLATLYLGIMTQAACSLGELWEQDLCDFLQVTISMGRLQQVLRALSPQFQSEAPKRTQTETLLLVPAPGEQHTFGLVVLAEFFIRDGWHVSGGPQTSVKQAVDIVRRSWIDVAGFSVGSIARLDGLGQCIRQVRRASHNRGLFVMVGGPLFLAHPELVRRVGADTAATDAASAVRQAHGLLAMRTAAD
jgi:methanogenic corrinoid protein MtbC1